MTLLMIARLIASLECGDYWPEHATVILRSNTTGNSAFVEVGCRD